MLKKAYHMYMYICEIMNIHIVRSGQKTVPSVTLLREYMAD